MDFADMESHVINKKEPFASVIVPYITYQAYKEDIVKKNYNLWLMDDIINFFQDGLCRTQAQNM